MSVPHIDTSFLSIFHIENLSTFGIDKKFISISGREIVSVLCIENTSTYDVYKSKFFTSQR